MIRDEQIAESVQCNACGIIQTRIGSHTAIAGIAIRSIACYGRDNAICVYLADAAHVRNEEIAESVQCNACGVHQTRIDCCSAIPGIARTAVARDGRDDAIHVHLADAKVAWVRNE